MKIGLVCPYAFDVPGGVQFHIRDLAEELITKGHQVSVLAPGELSDPPEWLVSVGAGAIPIPFNGSIARLSFGPVVASRTKKWIEEGDFDVIHIHEPGTPSIGLLALMNAENTPVVATFHAALDRSILRQMTSGILRPYLERIGARIAVSREARRTLIEHHAGDAVIIPNGVFCRDFADAEIIDKWKGTEDRPVITFLGRIDEPRKGLGVFARAIEPILDDYPGARFLIAGRGEAESTDKLKEKYPQSIELLGEITDAEKQSLLKGSTIYAAPQLGGESFGIVLVEAMSAGTTVVAANIPAFAAVLDDGNSGILFQNGDSAALSDAIKRQLRDPVGNDELGMRGQIWAKRFDWGTVSEQILAVYQAVQPTREPIQLGTAYERINRRLRRTGRSTAQRESATYRRTKPDQREKN